MKVGGKNLCTVPGILGAQSEANHHGGQHPPLRSTQLSHDNKTTELVIDLCGS